jgi:hypothetical protein
MLQIHTRNWFINSRILFKNKSQVIYVVEQNLFCKNWIIKKEIIQPPIIKLVIITIIITYSTAKSYLLCVNGVKIRHGTVQTEL